MKKINKDFCDIDFKYNNYDECELSDTFNKDQYLMDNEYIYINCLDGKYAIPYSTTCESEYFCIYEVLNVNSVVKIDEYENEDFIEERKEKLNKILDFLD